MHLVARHRIRARRLAPVNGEHRAAQSGRASPRTRADRGSRGPRRQTISSKPRGGELLRQLAALDAHPGRRRRALGGEPGGDVDGEQLGDVRSQPLGEDADRAADLEARRVGRRPVRRSSRRTSPARTRWSRSPRGRRRPRRARRSRRRSAAASSQAVRPSRATIGSSRCWRTNSSKSRRARSSARAGGERARAAGAGGLVEDRARRRRDRLAQLHAQVRRPASGRRRRARRHARSSGRSSPRAARCARRRARAGRRVGARPRGPPARPPRRRRRSRPRRRRCGSRRARTTARGPSSPGSPSTARTCAVEAHAVALRRAHPAGAVPVVVDLGVLAGRRRRATAGRLAVGRARARGRAAGAGAEHLLATSRRPCRAARARPRPERGRRPTRPATARRPGCERARWAQRLGGGDGESLRCVQMAFVEPARGAVGARHRAHGRPFAGARLAGHVERAVGGQRPEGAAGNAGGRPARAPRRRSRRAWRRRPRPVGSARPSRARELRVAGGRMGARG